MITYTNEETKADYLINIWIFALISFLHNFEPLRFLPLVQELCKKPDKKVGGKLDNLSPYEKALCTAENNNILIVQGNTSNKLPAFALRYDEDMGVFINEDAFETDAERRLAFIHEVAHCETGGFYTEKTPRDECDKIEYKANKRAVAYLVPFHIYKETIMSGCLTDLEQAEKWDVPVSFIPVIHQVYESTQWESVQELRGAALRKWNI